MTVSPRGLKSPIAPVVWTSLPDTRLDLNDRPIWDLCVEVQEDWLDKVIGPVIEHLLQTDEHVKGHEPEEVIKFVSPSTEPPAEGAPKGERGPVKPGLMLLKAKKNGVNRKTGKPNTPPTIVDRMGMPIPQGEIPQIGRGSKVIMLFDLFTYDFKGSTGISAGLRGCQIAELVAGVEDAFGALDEPEF